LTAIILSRLAGIACQDTFSSEINRVLEEKRDREKENEKERVRVRVRE
jgi:hypothetical protein